MCSLMADVEARKFGNIYPLQRTWAVHFVCLCKFISVYMCKLYMYIYIHAL